MANYVLELRGKRFVQAARNSTGGGISINSQKIITSDQIKNLQHTMELIQDYWIHQSNRPFEGELISVYYNKIMAKSNRIAGLLKGKKSNSAVVGAKFNEDKTKHIITYYVSDQDITKSIKNLQLVREILDQKFSGKIDKIKFGEIKPTTFGKEIISCSLFKQIIADLSYIDGFEIEFPEKPQKESLVTFYDTNTDPRKILKSLGINVLNTDFLDKFTVRLNPEALQTLFDKASYLVAMSTTDLSSLDPVDFEKNDYQKPITIPAPTNEPTIGVIDTLFDERVYFSEWVDYHCEINESIPIEQNDYRHGTEVSSIIVDGPQLNPWLDDNCGRFKVRHFGIAVSHRFSSFVIIKKIKEIVETNKDIKVWNISLGSNDEINDNFISAEAAVLDQIQFENDVIFVIAGTNKNSEEEKKFGSPADSINSMVVNAVTKGNKSTSYTRKGIVLSFYAKPDVSYYGGSKERLINVCDPLGEATVAGTSFAAPWIARKLSYLIDIMGLNRELAKALIIDAARGWEDKPTPSYIATYGHGIVPIKIEDIIQSKDDEIKFLVTDQSEKWNTYNYSFPVPLNHDKYPFLARATMCYFPTCNRAQGVDYTNTELNIHFGRINDKGKIIDIKGDKQNQDDKSYVYEDSARSNFRKWDNVKYVAETPKTRSVDKRSYSNKNWGMEIKTSNRLDSKDGLGLTFGVVVTLKEIHGVNRIDEFIKNCTLNGWIVNELDIQVRQNIYQKLNEDIDLR